MIWKTELYSVSTSGEHVEKPIQTQKITRLMVIILLGILASTGYASTYTEDFKTIGDFVVDGFKFNNMSLCAALWLFSSALFGVIRKFST